MKKFKKSNAITLVALVITIIVLLIIAGVLLSLVLGENGITQRAINSGKTQNIAGAKEELELDIANYGSEFYQAKYINGDPNTTSIQAYIMNKFDTRFPNGQPGAYNDSYTLTVNKNENQLTLKASTGSDRTTETATIETDGKVTWSGTSYEEVEVLAKTDVSYVGYYAEVDGEWGIIYADLLAQTPRNGQWGNSNGTWNLGAPSDASAYKSYKVNSTIPSDKTTFGNYTNTGVISLVSDTMGMDRFYVMKTENSGATGWSQACGTTAGTNNKWKLPTKKEWSIFGSVFDISVGSLYGLENYYWSSNQYPSTTTKNHVWVANFNYGYMYHYSKVSMTGYVRLSTTF